MRKLLLAIVAVFSLSGCATTGGGLPSASDLVTKIQAYTQQVCGFLPLVDSGFIQALIADLYPAGLPIAEAVSVIGNAICAGTSPRAARSQGGAVTYKLVRTPRGTVRVPGRYVR